MLSLPTDKFADIGVITSMRLLEQGNRRPVRRTEPVRAYRKDGSYRLGIGFPGPFLPCIALYRRSLPSNCADTARAIRQNLGIRRVTARRSESRRDSAQMPVLTPDKQFYDPAETVLVARELGHVDVSSSTVKKAAYYGDKPLKRTKIGGRVYFARQDIETWLASRIERAD